jgi:hypothetical protein
MTPAELTALLAPVRAELDAIDAEARRDYGAGSETSLANWRRLRAALDKLAPPSENGALIVLGFAALGMLKELRESEALGRARAGFVSTTAGEDWIERADALLAAAYPKS